MTQVRVSTSQPARRTRGRAPALLLAAAAAAMSVAVGGWACSTPQANAGAAPAAEGGLNTASDVGGQPAAAQAPAKEVSTTLTPTGFAPARLSHAAGRFNLRVKNRSGEREVTLRLTDAGGGKVTEVRLTDKVREWAGPVELGPGTYVLTEAARPDWTCRVEVTDR